MGSVGYLVRHFFALGQEVTSPANQGQSTKSFDQVKMDTNASDSNQDFKTKNQVKST